MNHFLRYEVEGVNTYYAVRNLLAIGADVLHGRSANAAGNARETFDAGGVVLDGSADGGIPFDSGIGFHDGSSGFLEVMDRQRVAGDANDDAGKAAVADKEVAAAAENEKSYVVGAGKADGGEHILFVPRLRKPAGGATNPEGSVLGQRNVFEKIHAL